MLPVKLNAGDNSSASRWQKLGRKRKRAEKGAVHGSVAPDGSCGQRWRFEGPVRHFQVRVFNVMSETFFIKAFIEIVYADSTAGVL